MNSTLLLPRFSAVLLLAAAWMGSGMATASAQSFTDTFSGAKLGSHWARSGGSPGATCTVNDKLTLATADGDKYAVSWVLASSKAFSFWDNTLTLSATIESTSLKYGGYFGMALLSNMADANSPGVTFANPTSLSFNFHRLGDGTIQFKLRGKAKKTYAPPADLVILPTTIANVNGKKFGMILSNTGGTAGATKITLFVDEVLYALSDEEMLKVKPVLNELKSPMLLFLENQSGMATEGATSLSQFAASLATAPADPQ